MFNDLLDRARGAEVRDPKAIRYVRRSEGDEAILVAVVTTTELLAYYFTVVWPKHTNK